MSLSLWLCRATPEKTDRTREFIEKGIIAIGWGKTGNLGNFKTQAEIWREIDNAGYPVSNVTCGVINHFVNRMQIGDFVIVPSSEHVYIGKINSPYLYKEHNVDYPHQRQVDYLNGGNPYRRADLPQSIQDSLRAQNTVADFTHRLNDFQRFIEGTTEQPENIEEPINIEKELLNLLPMALKNIKSEIECDDPNRRAAASIAVLKLLKEYDI